ncbi:helix-turn-helix domain-containing protein [Actinoalloteichus caeruleus]|uniref:helix-turn-helix domain-containing protein n=1 Tax=Actinoalloteichus cyanogriseus TaxID=2893586 RepID=UPI003AAE638E
MAEDWVAVAYAVNARARELSLKQKEIADKSGVSLAIVREIQQARIERRRNPRTLEALSLALDWHPRHLTAILHGETPPPCNPSAKPAQDPLIPLLQMVIRELRGLRAQVGLLTSRLTDVEKKRDSSTGKGD